MNIKEFLFYLENNKVLEADSFVHEFMHQSYEEARKIMLEINNNYHTQEETVKLMSRLTGRLIDESFKLFPPIYVDFGKNLIIGKNVFINASCCFQDHGGIIIGDNCLIGHEVVFATLNHEIDPLKRGSMTHKSIILEENVWVGSHSTILGGVRIGANSIIGAGSLVNKDIPPNTIVGGVPAHIIKKIEV